MDTPKHTTPRSHGPSLWRRQRDSFHLVEAIGVALARRKSSEVILRRLLAANHRAMGTDRYVSATTIAKQTGIHPRTVARWGKTAARSYEDAEPTTLAAVTEAWSAYQLAGRQIHEYLVQLRGLVSLADLAEWTGMPKETLRRLRMSPQELERQRRLDRATSVRSVRHKARDAHGIR